MSQRSAILAVLSAILFVVSIKWYATSEGAAKHFGHAIRNNSSPTVADLAPPAFQLTQRQPLVSSSENTLPSSRTSSSPSESTYIELPSHKFAARGTGEIVASVPIETPAVQPEEPPVAASSNDATSIIQGTPIGQEPPNGPARRLRDMPPGYRASFPQLSVEVHQYEKSRKRRFIQIGGRQYREGERLAEGPQVVEIVKEGIKFSFQGEIILYSLAH